MVYDEVELPGELNDDEGPDHGSTWFYDNEAPVPDIDSDGYSDEDKHTDANRPQPELCPECDYPLDYRGKCASCNEGAKYADSWIWGE